MKTISSVALIVALVVGISGFAAADAGEVLKAHFKAVGGLEKLSEIKTVKRSGDASMGGMMGEMSGTIQEVIVVGKKAYSKMETDMFTQTTAWNGTEGWGVDPMQGTRTLTGGDLEFAKAAIYLDPLQSVYEQFGAAAFEQGEDDSHQERACSVLKIANTDLKFYIDKETHHVLAMKTVISDPSFGDADLVLSYSDYSEHGGVKFPGSLEIDIADGMITINYDYTKTELDVDVDEAIFEKP